MGRIKDALLDETIIPEDTAIVFGIDDIGDTNSTLFRIYKDDNDPKIAEDLTLDSETKKYVMQLPGGSTKDSTKLTSHDSLGAATLTNGPVYNNGGLNFDGTNDYAKAGVRSTVQ